MLESLQLFYVLYPQAGAACSLIFGLLIGSFLNVVITRLPVMLEQSWREDAEAFLELTADEAPREKLSLASPRSHCPVCKTEVAVRDNIPLLSFVLLLGRCRHCQTPISWQYPAVEFISGIATVFLILQFGLSAQAAFACLLSYALLCLAVIDFRTTLLPDQITLSFLWLGLIANLTGSFVSLDDAVIGALGGYLSLWSVYWVFKLITGKEGMGFGDFKLLAALGAWLGWQALPGIILLSSFAGALIGLCLIALGRDRDHPIPFGPYLAIAGWIMLVWGSAINQYYFSLMGVR
jgi:leader peptidase (prepilin peptidase)/N-methyltransferase